MADTSKSRRRQVSVLFLDIVGSTSVISRLDPEEVLEVMDEALRHFAAVVTQLGGRVLQFAGDSMLAAFGAEVASEDDPERAVRAGLALLDAAKEQATRVQRRHGVDDFAIRVGVHTGEVLLGGGVDEDGTIRGYTVNIAARLEQSAPAGALRVSQDTWRHVRGVFVGEAQLPLHVKGHDGALLTWLVSAVRPRAFLTLGRGVDGLPSAFVGRGGDLRGLADAFERSAAERLMTSVTLLADAGLGKSRLLQEFQIALDAGPRRCCLLLGRALASGQQQPYGLLRDVVAWRLQIADSDDGETSRRKLVDGLRPFFAADGEEEATRQAELVGQLVGMDFSSSPRLIAALRDPGLLRRGALAAFATWLQRLASSDGSSIVLLLDDLHWADDASLKLLEDLRQHDDLPMLLVLAARPTLLERHPGWGLNSPRHETVHLQPLGADARRALLATLLARVDDVPEALFERIDRQAGGNPYYAEELMQMLLDVGVIEVGGECWRVNVDRLSVARVPSTLVGVLQARLDALEARTRTAIQSASVVGPVFWDDALATIEPAAIDELPALQQRSLVHARAESAFEGTRELGFQHHLLHQVTYDTLLRSDRRIRHSQAAAWLASRVGDRQAEYLALTADHYERAGDAVNAIDWLERAARSALDRFANSMTQAIVARVLDMPELVDARRRLALLKLQSMVADRIGDRALQTSTLAKRWDLANALDDDAMRAETRFGQALLADRTARYDDALVLAQEALALAERSDAAQSAALANSELAWLALMRGSLDEAEARSRAGLAWARVGAQRSRQPGERTPVSVLLTMLANVLIVRYDFDAATLALREALALSEQLHLVRSEMHCHDKLHSIALTLRDLPAAHRHNRACADAARRAGVPDMATTARVNEAALALAEGQPRKALAAAMEAHESAVRIGAKLTQNRALECAAHACADAGDATAARTHYEQALALAQELGLAVDERRLRILIADTVRQEGRPDAAMAALAPLLDATTPPAKEDDDEFRALVSTWRILYAAGDPRAAGHLASARGDLDRRVSRVADPQAHRRILAASALHREVLAGRPEEAARHVPAQEY